MFLHSFVNCHIWTCRCSACHLHIMEMCHTCYDMFLSSFAPRPIGTPFASTALAPCSASQALATWSSPQRIHQTCCADQSVSSQHAQHCATFCSVSKENLRELHISEGSTTCQLRYQLGHGTMSRLVTKPSSGFLPNGISMSGKSAIFSHSEN